MSFYLETYVFLFHLNSRPFRWISNNFRSYDSYHENRCFNLSSVSDFLLFPLSFENKRRIYCCTYNVKKKKKKYKINQNYTYQCMHENVLYGPFRQNYLRYRLKRFVLSLGIIPGIPSAVRSTGRGKRNMTDWKFFNGSI